MITINQLWTILLGVCGGIITISGAAAVIVNAISKAKAPERVLSQRVQACEDRLNLMEGRMLTIEKASSAIEQSQKITQEALWALLGHAIDGNNVDDLKKAQAKLHDHIFSS